ncbi:MAG: alpha/beta hydrolase [Patescibacteria group bacterium]
MKLEAGGEGSPQPQITKETENFGRGEITIIRARPTVKKADADTAPLFFVQGHGQEPNLEKYVNLFSKTGRETFSVAFTGPRRVNRKSSRNREAPEISAKVPPYQVDKAEDMIAAMDTAGIQQADIVAPSAGAIPALIALAKYPDRFRDVVFVHPKPDNVGYIKTHLQVLKAGHLYRKRVGGAKMLADFRKMELDKKGFRETRIEQKTVARFQSLADLVIELRATQPHLRFALVDHKDDYWSSGDELKKRLDPYLSTFVRSDWEGHGIGLKQERVDMLVELLAKMEEERETSQYLHPPIRWPHEEGRGLARSFKVRRPKREKGVPFQMEAMRRLNGPEAESLGNKFNFIELTHKLGYRTPPQILVNPEQNLSDRQELANEHFKDPTEKIICKPLHGVGGLKITELTAADLPAFLQTVTAPYIIQKLMPIEAEIRYARVADERNHVVRRIYDEKEIPKVVGDGRRTKGQLIRRGQVPWYSKMMTQLLNIGDLRTVVPEGSTVHLSFFGTPYKAPDELEWNSKKEQRVKNVDMFMQRFVSDFEGELQTPLPYLCFDIGILSPKEVLDKQYDSSDDAFTALKDILVPFEAQVPFSVYGYAKRSTATRREKWRIVRRMMGPGFLGGKKEDLIGKTPQNGKKGIK